METERMGFGALASRPAWRWEGGGVEVWRCGREVVSWCGAVVMRWRGARDGRAVMQWGTRVKTTGEYALP